VGRHREEHVSAYGMHYTRSYGCGRGQYAVNDEQIKVEPVLATWAQAWFSLVAALFQTSFQPLAQAWVPAITIEGGPNVKTEHGVTVGERRSRIVVDDVSDFIACLWTMDDPIVSVKWGLSAVRSEFEDQEMYEGWAEEKNWNLLEVRW